MVVGGADVVSRAGSEALVVVAVVAAGACVSVGELAAAEEAGGAEGLDAADVGLSVVGLLPVGVVLPLGLAQGAEAEGIGAAELVTSVLVGASPPAGAPCAVGQLPPSPSPEAEDAAQSVAAARSSV
ncbi:MAG: hypothetical protein PGN11_03450 [Quadrisphaera sp.]